jgi:hypothetical protein
LDYGIIEPGDQAVISDFDILVTGEYAAAQRNAQTAMLKPVRLSGHARHQLARRGISEAEVIDAIRTSPWQPAERGRLECRKDFPYGREWNGRFYTTKQVRPVFVEEAGEMVVVTVYSYFFSRG